MRFALPFALFVVVVALLAVGLQRDPRHVPSPLIGKPLPDFTLATLAAPDTAIARTDLLGQPYLLNVWASWCVACRQEHPLLVELARRGSVTLIGLNYKDARADALRWLDERGDPYRLSLFDDDGRLGLDLGVYGVPETFFIDAAGVIRHKHIGPLDAAAFERDIAPLIRAHGGGS
ncbi:MAG: DsbE family thiol:disulfide interchange protein [Gammaproteobacteria bacterium]